MYFPACACLFPYPLMQEMIIQGANSSKTSILQLIFMELDPNYNEDTHLPILSFQMDLPKDL